MEQLQKIRDLSWKEVFEHWRMDEEKSERWERYWRAKGFSSWEEWRNTVYKNLKGAELSWALYKVADPIKAVPEWRGGMFHAWATWFYPVLREQPPKLRDLIAHPGVHNNWLIREIANKFPTETMLSGIRLANGDVVVIEGMHRSCALTLAAHDQLSITTELTLALAEWPFGEVPQLGTGWEKK